MTDKTKPKYWFNVQANAIKSDGSTCGEISGCTYEHKSAYRHALRMLKYWLLPERSAKLVDIVMTTYCNTCDGAGVITKRVTKTCPSCKGILSKHDNTLYRSPEAAIAYLQGKIN